MSARDPRAELLSMQPLEPPISPADIDERLNLIERILGSIGPTDDLLRGALQNQRDILLAIRDQRDLLQQQVGVGLDTTNLPIGALGNASTGIPQDQTGLASFDGNITFQAQVTATEDIDRFDRVVIVGPGNQVSRAPEDQNLRDQRETDLPLTIRPRAYIDITNETWLNGTDRLDPDITFLNLPAPLSAGEETRVYEARSESANVRLFPQSSGATTHKSDMDSDGDDESVVRYIFEYQKQVGGDWIRHEPLTDTASFGSLSRPSAFVPGGGFIGPVFGWRLRYENRSDEAGFAASDVEQDEMAARLIARAQVL